jgi:hypothetical protein
MSNDEISKAKDPVSKSVTLGKDVVSLLRDLALFVLALLLLVFPTKFNTVLSNAGFEEGSLVGFKWKARLFQSDDALKQAQTTINDLTTQLTQVSNALSEAQAKLDDPALTEKVAKLEEESKRIQDTASRVESSVQVTIASNAPLVEKVPSSNWGIVFSGDATLDGAKYEVETIAQKLEIPNASVYFRQGSYRSVSVVDSETEAKQVLYKAMRRRADAYIVPMSNWCPRAIEKSGYRECVSP